MLTLAALPPRTKTSFMTVPFYALSSLSPTSSLFGITFILSRHRILLLGEHRVDENLP